MQEIVKEYGPLEAKMRRVQYWLIRLRKRYIPYLEWWGQEINVRAVFKEDRLPKNLFIKDPEDAMKYLNRGCLSEVERHLAEIGITFDRGMGCGGRDWELDWSLQGPLNIKFTGPCRTKNNRN